MKSIIALFAMVMFMALSAGAQPSYRPAAAAYYVRVPRATAELDGGRVQRQAGGGEHHHDVADFGAHTGHHGAFGWYADFPVHAHGN